MDHRERGQVDWPFIGAVSLLFFAASLYVASPLIEPRQQTATFSVMAAAPAPLPVGPAEPLPWQTWNLPSKGNQTLVVLRVIDGDTVDAAYLVPVRIRINGINAPELNTPAGKKAKLALENFLHVGVAQTWHLDGPEKYGRTLGDLQLTQGQETGWLSWWMTSGGYAVPYDGKGPRP